MIPNSVTEPVGFRWRARQWAGGGGEGSSTDNFRLVGPSKG
jgi:hypothetical protein